MSKIEYEKVDLMAEELMEYAKYIEDEYGEWLSLLCELFQRGVPDVDFEYRVAIQIASELDYCKKNFEIVEETTTETKAIKVLKEK